MSTRDLFTRDSLRSRNDSSSQSLCEKYRPRKIADFAGLDRAKAILQQFATQPRGTAWIFVGPTGVGKTSMAFALASEVAAELHHLAPTCTRKDVDEVWEQCQGFPIAGHKRHLILVDDVDGLSKAALTTILAKLDIRDGARDIIWVFTCPSTEELDRRFLSFCGEIKFPSYGIAKEATALLKRVWEAERGQADAIPPNFARIVKESNNDIRAALMTLEAKLMTKVVNQPIP